MCRTPFSLLLVFALLAVPAQAEKLYKWVDDRGVTHYGDSVPAEDARRERKVLNDQGIEVKVLPRERTDAEVAEAAARQAELAAQEQAQAASAERDRILLDTYLSVEEISMLRDRRILALEAQIGVTRHYLKNLQAKWEGLESDARRYNFPYQEDSDLPPLPDDIAQHLIHTEKAMAEHMQTVRALKIEQSNIRAEFERDMLRFKELTADLNLPGNAGSQPR